MNGEVTFWSLSGSFTGDLNRFPRAAKSMESCQIMDSSIPTVNLFKQKRIKGWWPFLAEDGKSLGVSSKPAASSVSNIFIQSLTNTSVV